MSGDRTSTSVTTSTQPSATVQASSLPRCACVTRSAAKHGARAPSSSLVAPARAARSAADSARWRATRAAPNVRTPPPAAASTRQQASTHTVALPRSARPAPALRGGRPRIGAVRTGAVRTGAVRVGPITGSPRQRRRGLAPSLTVRAPTTDPVGPRRPPRRQRPDRPPEMSERVPRGVPHRLRRPAREQGPRHGPVPGRRLGPHPRSAVASRSPRPTTGRARAGPPARAEPPPSRR